MPAMHVNQSMRTMVCRAMGKLERDSDSEEDDYSDGGMDAGWDDEEIEISPEDEAAMAAFRVPRPSIAAVCTRLLSWTHTSAI